MSLSRDEAEPQTFTAKIGLMLKKLSVLLARIPSIPGMPKLPTAVPALIGTALFVGVVTWCIHNIDTSFDTFSEDYVSSAAQKAFKKHNTTEAAELLLRFHLEHSGKMTTEHLLMLGQFLTMRADEAMQTRDYSTAANYLKKVPADCPQYAAAQTTLRDLNRGLTAPALVQPTVVAAPAGLALATQIHQDETTNASQTKDGQTLLVVPQVVPQTIQQSRPSEIQESKLQTSIPIWQRFSRGVTTNKSRTTVGSGGGGASGISSINISGNAGHRISRGNGGGEGKSDSEKTDSTSSVSEGESESTNSQTAENDRDKPKESGFFIDGKQVSHDSRSQEPEKSPERVAESARIAGPKSHPAAGQKSYNPEDISRYNELLANYFSQHDASSQKSTDKHVGGAEPPSFQEWISKGRPGFR